MLFGDAKKMLDEVVATLKASKSAPGMQNAGSRMSRLIVARKIRASGRRAGRRSRCRTPCPHLNRAMNMSGCARARHNPCRDDRPWKRRSPCSPSSLVRFDFGRAFLAEQGGDGQCERRARPRICARERPGRTGAVWGARQVGQLRRGGDRRWSGRQRAAAGFRRPEDLWSTRPSSPPEACGSITAPQSVDLRTHLRRAALCSRVPRRSPFSPPGGCWAGRIARRTSTPDHAVRFRPLPARTGARRGVRRGSAGASRPWMRTRGRSCSMTEAASPGALVAADGEQPDREADFRALVRQRNDRIALEAEAGRSVAGQGDRLEIDFAAADWGYGWVFQSPLRSPSGSAGGRLDNPDRRAKMEAYLEGRASIRRGRSDHRRGHRLCDGDRRGRRRRHRAGACGPGVSPGELYRADYASRAAFGDANRWRLLICPRAVRGLFAWAFADGTLRQGYL